MKFRFACCIVAAASTLMLQVNTSTVYALKCAPPPSVQEEMELSELVFKGKLISQSEGKLEFKVTDAWKGEATETMELRGNTWSEFENGKEYMVFANKDHGEFSPRLCGNTGSASSFNEALLGESIPIRLGSGGFSSIRFIMTLFGVLFACTGGLVALILCQRRLKR